MADRMDPRYVLRGFDGELYTEGGDFLANVNTWQAQINVTNSDYQPAGSALNVAVLQSYTVTLTFTETVCEDATMLQALVEMLTLGNQPVFGFQGVVRGHDGTTGTYVFRNVVPDGNIDVANISPGEVVNRAWSFRVNDPPELSTMLGTGQVVAGTAMVDYINNSDQTGDGAGMSSALSEALKRMGWEATE